MRKKKNYYKKKKKKSFYFKHYVQTKDIENVNTKTLNNLNISFNRVIFVFFIFISLISIFSFKIIYLSISKDTIFSSKPINTNLIKTRSDIIDKNEVIIARNIDIYSAAVRSNLVKDKKKLLINLRLIFPNLNFKKIESQLEEKNFFYIKKRLSEEERHKLWLLGDKSITFEKKQIRVYPQKNLFSHIIGQIDEDNNGISGIEKSFDKRIKNIKIISSPLQLTLDSNLQFLIREELLKAHTEFEAIGSAAVLMNVENGEILSLVSLPDFDLNRRSNINDVIYTNKITKGVYELGSVFKSFTLAAALENNVLNVDTKFKNLKNKIFCGGKSISEHDKLPKDLSAQEILIRSSNIGAVRIAQQLGKNKFKDFLNSLKLFQKINFEIEEVGTPLKFRWGKCKLATASFGHGITTTPLQLARAYAILGNGGTEVQPTLLKDNVNFKVGARIISSKTSDEINLILRKVVKDKEGTANFANVEGYEVGGKTGTALKSFNGVYSKKKFNTFVSLFPTSKPSYVLLVILDEPKPAPELTYIIDGYKVKGIKRNESGWNAVYVAGKIIEKIGPILAINKLQAFKNF